MEKFPGTIRRAVSVFDQNSRIFPEFNSVYDTLESAIEEVGFIYGYQRYLTKLPLKWEVVEEGINLTRHAYNLRQKMYRAKEAIIDLTENRERLLQTGKYLGEAKDQLDKDMLRAEDRVAVLSFDMMLKVRLPFDDYLMMNEIEERKPYNKKPPKPKKEKENSND